MVDLVSTAPTVTLADADRPVGAVAPGTRIGRYVVLDHLGAGGMGSVYAAYDAQLERRVAIKVLRPEARRIDGHARLLREAQAMARLAHPNVVTVFDVGTFGDDVFIAMDHIVGRTLKAWMAEPHPWREALAVLKAAGRGLEAAHAAGIIHRDFKPENVLIGNDGRVAVADFGIARAHDSEPGETSRPHATVSASAPSLSSLLSPADARSGPTLAPSLASTGPSALEIQLTEPGALIGTAGYMAPERALDSRDDARSDQFSFGVTLHRVLYGESPFVFSSVATYLKALGGPPRSPPPNTPVPAWIHAVIARALQRDPADRFASMAELLAALDRDPTRRRRGLAVAAAALGLVAMGAFGWGHQRAVVREECAAGDRLIVETWNPGVRDAIGAAILSTNVPLAGDVATRTQRVLDDWAAAWKGAYREASEATRMRGTESAATMKIRLACLDRAREDMGALAHRLAHADNADARHAINAALQLPKPQMCWEPNAAKAAALPEAPGPRARVLALEKQIAEASELAAIGACDAAIPVTTKGMDEARAIPHRESEAELLLVQATCEIQKGDHEAAVATRQRAFVAELAAGDDSLAAITAALIALELGDDLSFREAERWLATGRGELEREGKDDRAEGELLEAEYVILSVRGYAERTIPLHERAIALFSKVYGPTSPRVAFALTNYATDLLWVGRQDEALTALRQSIRIQEAIYGTLPLTGIDYNNLGWTYLILGRYDEARTALEHALVLLKPLGEINENAIMVWASMAQLDNRSGRPDAALDDVVRAIAIEEKTGDNGARYLPCLFVERGMALLAKGDAGGARAACTQSLKLEEAQDLIGSDKVYSDDALTCLGEADLALGKVDEALVHLERGATLKKRDSAAALPLAQFALAKALRTKGESRTRARALAEGALHALRRAAGVDAQRRAVEAWLAADGGG